MVSLRTALIIQAQDTQVIPYQHKSTAKFGFEIGYFERGNYRLLLSSEAIYDSQKEAEIQGRKIEGEIKNIDLNEKKQSLTDIVEGKQNQ